ncbi:hypothetical protein EMPG_14480, partial [Blastomyces silverae]
MRLRMMRLERELKSIPPMRNLSSSLLFVTCMHMYSTWCLPAFVLEGTPVHAVQIRGQGCG